MADEGTQEEQARDTVNNAQAFQIKECPCGRRLFILSGGKNISPRLHLRWIEKRVRRAELHFLCDRDSCSACGRAIELDDPIALPGEETASSRIISNALQDLDAENRAAASFDFAIKVYQNIASQVPQSTERTLPLVHACKRLRKDHLLRKALQLTEIIDLACVELQRFSKEITEAASDEESPSPVNIN